MDCRDFEAKIDQYLDAVLPRTDMSAASRHVRGCKGCNDLVTSYQHASALLRTAVADKAAAVDVSGLWSSIEARLDAAEATAGPERSRAGLAARIRGLNIGGRLHGLVIGILGPAPVRAGAFAAAAAALALFVLSGMSDEKVKPIASGPGAQQPIEISRHDPDRPRTKHVRIDNLDIAPGRSVATWSRPRTRTQVIWVNSPEDGSDESFGVSPAAATAR